MLLTAKARLSQEKRKNCMMSFPSSKMKFTKNLKNLGRWKNIFGKIVRISSKKILLNGMTIKIFLFVFFNSTPSNSRVFEKVIRPFKRKCEQKNNIWKIWCEKAKRNTTKKESIKSWWIKACPYNTQNNLK